MKIALMTLFWATGFSFQIQARLQFPEYETIGENLKQFWGFVVEKSVTRKTSTLSVSIPAKAAPFCKRARLLLHDKQGHIQMQTDIALLPNPDGSLSIYLQLYEALLGDATLVVYTERTPDMPYAGYGGFLFKLPTKLLAHPKSPP